MLVSVGTFNLNNLFSRWNFRGAIDAIEAGGQDSAVTVSYPFDDPDTFKIRTFKGRLVQPKDEVDTERIAARILAMDVDVLAVQEVENIGILRQFNREQLGGLYDFQVLIEGNCQHRLKVDSFPPVVSWLPWWGFGHCVLSVGALARSRSLGR